jgi:beta-galactosidase
MDRVELFHNGRSLGAKDVQKDQHLAWIVKYAPGGSRRAATGRQTGDDSEARDHRSAAKLVLRPDRQEISADGEDAAICTVEVQDARGRVLPITDNQDFQGDGPGEVIGTGNGDPTNHEPDGGPARKAFAGLCMAIVQSSKTRGA